MPGTLLMRSSAASDGGKGSAVPAPIAERILAGDALRAPNTSINPMRGDMSTAVCAEHRQAQSRTEAMFLTISSMRRERGDLVKLAFQQDRQ